MTEVMTLIRTRNPLTLLKGLAASLAGVQHPEGGPEGQVVKVRETGAQSVKSGIADKVRLYLTAVGDSRTVSVSELSEATGCSKAQIRQTIYYLKRRNELEIPHRGRYRKAS